MPAETLATDFSINGEAKVGYSLIKNDRSHSFFPSSVSLDIDAIKNWAKRTLLLDPSALDKVIFDVDKKLREHVESQINELQVNLKKFNEIIGNKLNIDQLIPCILYQRHQLKRSSNIVDDMVLFMDSSGAKGEFEANLNALKELTADQKNEINSIVTTFSDYIKCSSEYLDKNYFTGIPDGPHHFQKVKNYVSGVVEEHIINSLYGKKDQIHLSSDKKEALGEHLKTLQSNNMSFARKHRVTDQSLYSEAGREKFKGISHMIGAALLGSLTVVAISVLLPPVLAIPFAIGVTAASLYVATKGMLHFSKADQKCEEVLEDAQRRNSGKP